MVAKISHGTSLYGALVYNHEKVFQGTAEILSGHRMISDRPGLPSEDMRLALLSFENHLTAKVHKKAEPRKFTHRITGSNCHCTGVAVGTAYSDTRCKASIVRLVIN